MITRIEQVQEWPVEGVMVLRVNTYRESGEAGYDEHHVQVAVIPQGGYPGKVDAEGNPAKQKDYDNWYAGLPLVWQNNPCLNQFIVMPLGTDLAKVQAVITTHAGRVTVAPLNTITGFPKVVDPAIQGELKKQLQGMGLWVAARPRSILSKDAVNPNSSLLNVEVKA